MPSIKILVNFVLKQGKWISLFLLFAFISCSGHTTEQKGEEIVKEIIIRKNPEATENPEEQAINAVMALPEVEAANRYIDSISDHQKGVAAIYDGKEEGSEDISIRVGYNGGERFEVYYFFYVNPQTMQIRILDIVNDTLLPVEEWRKQNHPNRINVRQQ